MERWIGAAFDNCGLFRTVAESLSVSGRFSFCVCLCVFVVVVRCSAAKECCISWATNRVWERKSAQRCALCGIYFRYLSR